MTSNNQYEELPDDHNVSYSEIASGKAASINPDKQTDEDGLDFDEAEQRRLFQLAVEEFRKAKPSKEAENNDVLVEIKEEEQPETNVT